METQGDEAMNLHTFVIVGGMMAGIFAGLWAVREMDGRRTMGIVAAATFILIFLSAGVGLV